MSIITPVDVLFDSEETSSGKNVSGNRDNPIFSLLPAISNCVGVSVIYVNVPFTYYVLDTTNNSFAFSYGGSAYSLLTLIPGTYNSSNISAQFISAVAVAGFAAAAADLVAYVDSTTSQFIVYSAANTAFAISFILGGAIGISCARTLGFNEATYTASNSSFTLNNETVIAKVNIQSPRVVNLSGPGQMFLSSTFGSSIYGKVRNQTGASSLLGFWPVNSNYQGTIEYLREIPPMITFSKCSVSSLDMKLLLGNRTVYNNGVSNVPYLPLQGEAYQIGIRFYIDENSQIQTMDGLGNAAIVSTHPSRSSVFNPLSAPQIAKKIKR